MVADKTGQQRRFETTAVHSSRRQGGVGGEPGHARLVAGETG